MKAQGTGTKRWQVGYSRDHHRLVVGWYWFWPERVVTNRRVDEAFPAINDSAAQILV